jgi:hypothetical protein
MVELTDSEHTQFPTSRLFAGSDVLQVIRPSLLATLSSFELDEPSLGPADQTDKWREWDLVLARARGAIRINSEWLVVRFDRDGRVAEHRVVQD